MKFSTWEKVGGSVLIAAWLIYGVNFIGDSLVQADEAPPSAKKAMSAKTAKAPAKTAQAPSGGGDALALLASVNPDAGVKVFKKCKSCHTAGKGGKNKVGPNLWGAVGRKKASHGGFKYSSTFKGLDGNWGYKDLDTFLSNPKAYAKGNKMTFAGLKKASDRAAVILYLRGQSDSPLPLP